MGRIEWDYKARQKYTAKKERSQGGRWKEIWEYQYSLLSKNGIVNMV